jgi:hypothetical protein
MGCFNGSFLLYGFFGGRLRAKSLAVFFCGEVEEWICGVGVRVAGCRFRVACYMLQVAGCRLRVSSCGFRVSVYGITMLVRPFRPTWNGLGVTFELQVTGYRLQVASYLTVGLSNEGWQNGRVRVRSSGSEFADFTVKIIIELQ